MADYALAREAELDLLEIARFTAHAWSLDQANRYLAALDAQFAAIARNDAVERAVFDHREDLRVSRCRHHCIFFVRDDDGRVVVLAVLHESMDLIARLGERLG